MKIKQENFKDFWKRLWHLIKPSQKQLKRLSFFLLVLELASLIGPYLLKYIIDIVTDFQRSDIGLIILLVLGMFLVNQAISVLDYFTNKKIIRILADIETYLPTRAHKKLLSLSLGYHEKENTGNKISKVQRGVDKIMQLFFSLLWEVGPTLIQLTLTIIVLFFIDYRFGLILLFFTPAFVVTTLYVNQKVFPYRKTRHDNYEKSAGMMAQSIININTVKSFNQEKREEKEFGDITKLIKISSIKEFATIFKFNWGRNLIIDLGRVSIIFFGVYLVWVGNITVGSLVFVITISEKALISLFRISRLYDRIMESSEAIDRLYYLDKEESEIVNPDNGLKPKNIKGKIEFNRVKFSYPETRDRALDDVSLTISPGGITALVGLSGGGKSTVAKMIYRHYDPQKGNIFLDGKNLGDYDLFSLRSFIAIVPQEVEIFNSSVKGNIAYSNPRASQREIKAAASIANAEEFIINLNNGYDTLVGERGIKLSGGQRQRIGIARAILANPKILIFDEATSNLDSYSEKLIQDAMDKISRGRTMIVIAHRLSTIKKADQIVVLEGGKIVEKGSHYELSRQSKGLYAKLLKLQELGDVE